MIKLIACDMDGTLLSSDKKMPRNINKVIDYLQQQNILFTVASGRQYDSLKNSFPDYYEKIAFISDNGGFIHLDGQCYEVDSVDHVDFDEVVNSLKGIEASIVFSGKKQAFVISDYYDAHRGIIDEFFRDNVLVTNTNFSERIAKIAILDKTGELPVHDIFKNLLHKYIIVKSEERWFDIMSIGHSKGKAIKILQELKNISFHETMVFGDMINDYEMMQSAYYSYAMGNAIKEIKEVSRYTTDTNDNQGVIVALEKYFNTKFD